MLFSFSFTNTLSKISIRLVCVCLHLFFFWEGCLNKFRVAFLHNSFNYKLLCRSRCIVFLTVALLVLLTDVLIVVFLQCTRPSELASVYVTSLLNYFRHDVCPSDAQSITPSCHRVWLQCISDFTSTLIPPVCIL